MKSANSSNRPAALRAAGLRPWLVAPLCLLALACGLLAGIAAPRASAAAQDDGQKAKAAASDAGKGAARPRAAQGGDRAKPSVTKTRDAQPLADQIGCTRDASQITINGGTISGTLGTGDCRHPIDNSFYDAYTFTATAGQLVLVELASSDFDTYLYLLRPGETTLSYRSIQHDDIDSDDPDVLGDPVDLNSRLFGVLPGSGNSTYTILANSARPGETGAYTLRVRNVSTAACTATNLGSGTNTFTRNGSLTSGDCQLRDGSFVDVYSFTAAAGQQVSVTMQATSGTLDPLLFLLSINGFTELARNDDGLTGGANNNFGARIPAPSIGQGQGLATLPGAGTYYILANALNEGETGNYTLTLTLGSNCPTQAITAGQTVSGSLATTDCRLPFDGSFIDVYTFAGTAGQQISVSMTSTFLNSANGSASAWLLLYDPDGFRVDETDPDELSTTARLPNPSVGGFLTLPVTGTYRIYANAAAPDVTGSYTLSVATSDQTPTATVAFDLANYSVSEGASSATITVTRGGITSAAASVDYRTEDSDNFTVGCADAAGAAGAAFARCDYATTVGTLSFAPGEASKTISVPVIDDAHVEGPQTFRIALANPSGAALSSPSVTTVTITDNDAAGQPNPVLGPPFNFFVRQQYLDFLSREPDQGGFQAWLGVLNGCPNPFTGPEVSSGCDRIHVSGEGFFRSVEFSLKGAYVFRFYKVAFDRLPEYPEITSDMSFVAGATEAEVFARRAALAVRFTQRQEFLTRYPSGMTNQEYVAALLSRYQLTQITTPDPASPDTGGKVVLTQSDLAARLTAGTLTRAQVLRAVVDSDQVTAAEFNNAFVAMQYYGYLRRKPEPTGYADWLKVLQSGDTRTMVNGFLNSPEYKLRFGPN
ncbi:MAG TPA: DUF4214 domain-containing protein [Pyrinomonadaceae bacterium]|nr:DUF4214 domain-containing protein [Pyrinomonadaceae bacterium]